MAIDHPKAYRRLGGTLFFVALVMMPILLWVVRLACFHQASLSDKEQALIRAGDLIVRKGTAAESFVIQSLSDSPYSHIGVIVATHPVTIIHATTDDNAKLPNQVIRSRFEEFTRSDLAYGWAIYRVPLSDTEKISLLQGVQSELHKPFTLAVRDDIHTQALYCTTLIFNHYPPRLQKTLRWQRVDFPAFHGQMLFPNALIKQAQLIISSDSR